MKIIPGTGIDKITFGMKQSEVIEILGEPDEIEEVDQDDNIQFVHYDEAALSFSFDGHESWKLTTIVAAHEDSTLFSKKIFDLSLAELESELKKNGSKHNVVEENEDQASIESEDLEMIFWFENGELMEIQWGPFFADENHIVWPS